MTLSIPSLRIFLGDAERLPPQASRAGQGSRCLETAVLSLSMRRGLANGLRSVGALARIMVPVYVLVDLLQQSGAVEILAKTLAPAMRVFGLPGEAALVLVAGGLLNLYAAIGALAPLALTPREVTILGLMLGLAHGLLLETAILRQVGTRWASLAVLRVLLAAAAGAALHWVLP